MPSKARKANKEKKVGLGWQVCCTCQAFEVEWPVLLSKHVILCAVQMDMHVMSPSNGFDEGADAAQWQHWAPH